MRMHSPKFKKTIIENVKALPHRRSALALRARQTATPKSFPALAAVSLREERRPRPNSPQKPQPHPASGNPQQFPQQRPYIACSANRKSRTMQPSIREQPASPGNTNPSHSKPQVKRVQLSQGKKKQTSISAATSQKTGYLARRKSRSKRKSQDHYRPTKTQDQTPTRTF
ncbi:Uncharacterised protein [Mobiluncus mulieris]|nr:Uncharacterised protein [Mobiluncus mulieris]